MKRTTSRCWAAPSRRALSALVVCLWSASPAEAAPKECPHGYKRDGTCRAKQYVGERRTSRPTLVIRTTPPGAKVTIDGEISRTTNLSLAKAELGPGYEQFHKFEFELGGYEKAIMSWKIPERGNTLVDVRLVRTGKVVVENPLDVACELTATRASGSESVEPEVNKEFVAASSTRTVQLPMPGSYKLTCDASGYTSRETIVALKQDSHGDQIPVAVQVMRHDVVPVRVNIASDVLGVRVIAWPSSNARCADKPATPVELATGASSRVPWRGGTCFEVPGVTHSAIVFQDVRADGDVYLPLLDNNDTIAEVVSITEDSFNRRDQICTDGKDKRREPSTPKIADTCAHVAYVLSEVPAARTTAAEEKTRRRRAGKKESIGKRGSIGVEELFGVACDRGDARACEAHAVVQCSAAPTVKPCGVASLERACSLGRSNACLRRLAPDGAVWPTVGALYSLSDESWPLEGRVTRDERESLDDYTSDVVDFFTRPAVVGGFAPQGPADHWFVKFAWFTAALPLVPQKASFGVKVWRVDLRVRLASLKLLHVENVRYSSGDGGRQPAQYGGMVEVAEIAFRFRLKPKKSVWSWTLVGGFGGSLGYLDGFAASFEPFVGTGFLARGWGLEVGIDMLQYAMAGGKFKVPEGTYSFGFSSKPSLGVYVGLQTNFGIFRRRRK